MAFRGGTPRGAPRRLSRSNSQCSCCSETSSGSRGRFGQGVGHGSATGGLGRRDPGIVESLQNFTLNPDEYAYSMTYENTQFGIRRDLPKVILPKFLTKKQGRWVIQDNGPVELPLKREVTTILLAVDKEDVMYFRNVETEEYNKIDPSSFNFMYKTLQSFYNDCKYQLQHCIGQTNDNWVPIVGEVVVVQVGKVNEVNSPPRKPEHFNETIPGYERAVVICLDPRNGVFVDLLDDYGKGWVKPVECFKIRDFFTHADAQKYACELPGLDLIHPNHVLGSVLKRFPIKGICVRRSLNHMNIKWTGDKSPSGNPLVTVTVNVHMNTTLNLRQHVFRNLPMFLDPRATLSKDHWSMGRILDINKNGFMYLRLKTNDLMLMTIRECLDSLGEVSRDLALKPEHLKTNLGTGKESDIYIVKLSGVEEERDPNEKPFYRVTILEKKGTEVLIQCLDHLVLRQSSLDELIPLGRVYPDLKYIPPLVCRVHLHPIKKIRDFENVKSLFAHQLVRIRLVRAYPFHLCPPEVFIDLTSKPVGWKEPDDDDAERNAKIAETCSLAAWIIKKGWAEEADPVFMSSYDALINAEVEKNEKLKRVKGYHPIYKSGKPDKKFDNFLKQRMFTGDLIQFQRSVVRREKSE